MSSERVLVWLKYRFIGDAVLTTPLLRSLAGAYQSIEVLAAPHLMVLLKEEPGLTFVQNSKIEGIRSFFAQAAELRRRRYDVAVIVNRSFRSALIARFAGIRRRIGFPTERRGFLLTDRVPYDDFGFEGSSYARLGGPLGLQVPEHPPALTLTAEERRQGVDLLQGATVGLQPGASWSGRAIPTEHCATIANNLTRSGHPVALFGGKEERSFTERLLPLLEAPPVDLVGKTDLRATMSALGGLKVFVAADSGLVHTAVGLGTPTVTTFSLSPARKWGHRYAPHRVFEAPEADMKRMNVQAVIDAALERL